MKLRCVQDYSCPPRGLWYRAGTVIEVDQTLGEWLQRDAPGCFELYVEPPAKPRRKSMRKPPEDKQVTEPAEEK